jgi:hypothetical protein
MKIIALVNWYDERDDWLDAAIRSLTKAQVDHVVAVDGAYALFPDAQPQSPPSNAETIQRTCDELGIGCTIHTRDTVWEGNEIEKRTFLFRAADEVAKPNVDWFLVWDADQRFGRCNNLKPRLAQTHLDAADLWVIEPIDPREKDKIQYHPGTTIAKPQAMPVRLMYRAIPGIYCDRNHYTYRTPDGRRLWGNPIMGDLEPGLELFDVHVLHKTKQREVRRNGQAIRYYNTRDNQRVEDSECYFCGGNAEGKNIAYNWEWLKVEHPDPRLPYGWSVSSSLVPACRDCTVKHGTSRDRPLIMPCPECEGNSSRRNPCPFCNSARYIKLDANQVQMRLRPAIHRPMAVQ